MGASQTINAIIGAIINPTIALIFSAGLLVFLWGIVQFIWNSDNEEERKVGQRHIIWGFVGMFIMVAWFGISNIIAGTFNLGSSPTTSGLNSGSGGYGTFGGGESPPILNQAFGIPAYEEESFLSRALNWF
jgi:hypothetical protein